MALWAAGVNTLAPLSSPAQAGQVGLGTRLVQENQFRRVETGLLAPPGAARTCDIRAVLFTGSECLFLYVSPIFSKV